jgi:hypothetical protein
MPLLRAAVAHGCGRRCKPRAGQKSLPADRRVSECKTSAVRCALASGHPGPGGKQTLQAIALRSVPCTLLMVNATLPPGKPICPMPFVTGAGGWMMARPGPKPPPFPGGAKEREKVDTLRGWATVLARRSRQRRVGHSCTPKSWLDSDAPAPHKEGRQAASAQGGEGKSGHIRIVIASGGPKAWRQAIHGPYGLPRGPSPSQ